MGIAASHERCFLALLTVPLIHSQVPDLLATDSDSDKRRDSFDEGTIEVIRTYGLDFDDFYNDKSAMLASMAGGPTFYESVLSAVDLAGTEEEDSWDDDEPISPLTCERKRVASRETGSESPSKRTLPLRPRDAEDSSPS